VEATRAQIAEHRRFRALASELVEVSEDLADVLLHQDATDTTGEGDEKGGSGTPSRRRSGRSSTRS
jgi:hypothetical protein